MKRGISPIVATVLMLAVTVVAAAILAFVFSDYGQPSGPSTAQTQTHTETDYFNMTCAELKGMINSDVDYGQHLPPGYGQSGQVQAVALLEIYQIKGCPA